MGNLPKPIIWTEPGSVIALYKPVIIWCQGSWEAQKYHLYKEGSADPWDSQFPLETGNKAKFNIRYMTARYAGIYKCYYKSDAGFSEHSDAMELVMTGFGRFILIQEGKHHLSWTLDSQHKANLPSQATFVLDAVTPNHTGTFRCYGFLEMNHRCGQNQVTPLTSWSQDTKDQSPAPTEDGLETHWKILTGVLASFLLLLFFLLLCLILFRYRRRSKKKAEDVAGAEGTAIQTLPDENPQGIMYAQVKPSRLRTDTTSKENQAVIYTQLCSRTQEQNQS
ncbi:Leukocyte immunoglobulin-like receptor subfamily B member 4A [Apodemus speciosus]|uniref:Leukocyte immunoglobulin-like receptor subfamily B member 4A n=1 Tax=Apodemus speciosus TaxID=105296 RepID=A0ABQ0FTM5_APOSI